MTSNRGDSATPARNFELMNDSEIEEINQSLEGLGTLLSRLFEDAVILPDGSVMEQKKFVMGKKNVKIYVYPKEHPPPHFHVKVDGKDYTFEIGDCSPLDGKIGNRAQTIVEYLYNTGGKKLIEDAWDKTRPDNCPVGKIKR